MGEKFVEICGSVGIEVGFLPGGLKFPQVGA
jgi:hypothetical protein